MYIVKCTFFGSNQTLAKVAVAVAGGIDNQNQDAIHVRIEVAEHTFRKLERRSQIVGYEEAAVPQILACPKAVRENETVYSEEGNGLKRGLPELTVLKITKERNMVYLSRIIDLFLYLFANQVIVQSFGYRAVQVDAIALSFSKVEVSQLWPRCLIL